MKNIYITLIVLGLMVTSCVDLNLSPLTAPTTGNWFQDKVQYEMSVNDLFRETLWPVEKDSWSDDESYRQTLDPFMDGSFGGQNGTVTSRWADCYKVIGRANVILENLRAGTGNLSAPQHEQYLGEVLFARASMYMYLLNSFGDVVYADETIDIETALTMGRSPKEEVLQKVYDDFDEAARLLPVSHAGQQRATRGAVWGMKARLALYNEDWDIVIKATQDCMDLGIYELYPDYEKLFHSATHNTSENVWAFARSYADGVYVGFTEKIPRNNGGYAGRVPNWDLLAAYLCTDGLPVDESPLFDPHDPFKNRDPRCTASIVPFGSRFLNFEYDPNPVTGKEVTNYTTGKEQTNQDNKIGTTNASYNGLLWKKFIDESCLVNKSFRTEHDKIIVRYADILLMYAEAMIEKGTIDKTVLSAINQVRARAYGVPVESTDQYPAVTTTDQTKLRTILRMERRMEFAAEGLRFWDLIRWRLCEKVLRMKNYGIYGSSQGIIDNVVNKGYWFWPVAPQIDENGIADFSKLEEMRVANPLAQRSFNERQYLWPVPTKELLTNENLKPNNPGY